MKYGVYLPTIGPFVQENIAECIRQVARHAEVLGFDSLWCGDQVVFPAKLNQISVHRARDHGTHEYRGEHARSANHIESCRSLYSNDPDRHRSPYRTYRNPLIVAKSAATIDVLSGGRFTLEPALDGWSRSSKR